MHYLSFANFTLLITFFHLCLKGIQLQSLLQFQFWSFMLYNSNLGRLCCEISVLVLFMWQSIIASKAHRHKAPASTASYNNNVLGKSKFDLITIPFDILNFLATVRIANFCLNCIWLPICHVLAKTGKNVF